MDPRKREKSVLSKFRFLAPAVTKVVMEVALKSGFVCPVYLLVYITSEDDNIGWRMWVNYMWLLFVISIEFAI